MFGTAASSHGLCYLARSTKNGLSFTSNTQSPPSIEEIVKNSERYCGSKTKIRVVGTLLSVEAFHEIVQTKYVIMDELGYQIDLTKLLEGNFQPLLGEKYEVQGYIIFCCPCARPTVRALWERTGNSLPFHP